MDYYTRAEAAAENADDPGLLADVYSDKGQIHYIQGNFVDAVKAYETAAELYLEAKGLYDAGRMYINLSSSYTERAEYDLALNNLEKALPIAEELSSYEEMNSYILERAVKNNMGVIYFHQEMFDEAMEVQQELLESSREMGDQYGIADALNNLGNIYNAEAEDSLKTLFGANFQDSTKVESSDKFLNMYNEALSYYNQAYEVRQEINDMSGMASVSRNIAIIYLYSGKPSMALEPLEKARELNETLNDNASQAVVYQLLGEVYMAFGNYDTALDYLLASINDEENPAWSGAEIEKLTLASLTLGYMGEAQRAQELLARADRLISRARLNGVDNWSIYYSEGVLLTLRGDTDRAIEKLQQAYERGFREQWVLEIDRRLDPLRDRPEFLVFKDRISEDLTRAVSEIRSASLAAL
jgi:tetratricopeptide (TPR) repeat protein